jgi:dihydropteroate synthase
VDSSSPSGVFLPDLIAARRTIGSRPFDFSRQVAVGAAVHLPALDGGRPAVGMTAALDAALAEGADWVEIGGPSGPAGPPETESQELARVIPQVGAARTGPDVVVSVSTGRAEVARQALAAGAAMVNDPSGLRDPGLADLVAAAGAALVITHPFTAAPTDPASADFVAGVAAFLAGRARTAIERGVPAGRIIIDPGHDLADGGRRCIELTRRLTAITALGYPTLVCVSHGPLTGTASPQRAEATLAALVACVLAGARLVRVRDVRPTVAATRMTGAILGWRPPAVARHNLV